MTHPAFHVVPPGHDLPASHPTPIPGVRAGRRAAVLCVANWQPRKGILALLDAVAALPTDAVTLHLVGDETVDDRYRRQVLDRLGRRDLRDRVVRHGIVPPERIGALYDAADVFALASTEEPYGIVYGEAMAAGLPVVGWNAGNLPALIDDGVEGRTLPVDEVLPLTDALRELADDELIRKRLGAAALERATDLPRWNDTARQFYAVCRSLADGPDLRRR
jgi:glycosyltransferase involved in cell wall biosynthesis